MPYKCCVTGCKGNYRAGPKVHVFSFPLKNAILLEKWKNAIPRKNFHPTKYTKVCELHFKPDEIKWSSSAFDPKTGKVISAKLKHAKLTRDAIPSRFSNCPTYLSSMPSTSREAIEERRIRSEFEALQNALNESAKQQEEKEKQKKFTNLEELIACVNMFGFCDDESTWHLIKINNAIHILNFETVHGPKVQCSVSVNCELSIEVFFLGNKMTHLGKQLLPEKITNIDDLKAILNKLLLLKNDFNNDNTQVILKHIEGCIKKLQLDEDLKPYAIFIQEQLLLLGSKKERFRYSPELMVLSCLLFTISPHAYSFLRRSKIVILPHPSTLRYLTARLSVHPHSEQYDIGFLMHIKNKVKTLADFEKTVILIMDEIHIKPHFDYKGGNILGMSNDGEKTASSAYVFMISSMLSSFKEVVHVCPVQTVEADSLYLLIKKLIVALENIGLRVICVVSDNNAMNLKAMSCFASPAILKIVYKHPCDSTRPLFFVLDSVHILKCIRNNWLNQKTTGQRMIYPKFETGSLSSEQIRCVASLPTLRRFHELQFDLSIKYGCGLSLKALCPSSLERQNVKLVLNIFNEAVIQGLLECSSKRDLRDAEETANYLKIILNWWNVVNVKNPHKGELCNNKLQEPLTVSSDSAGYSFLNHFMDWLDRWKSVAVEGTLTKETHSAAYHTSHALVELANYCINDLGMSYILPGKVQTDALEERFGWYRQLADSQ